MVVGTLYQESVGYEMPFTSIDGWILESIASLDS